MLLPKHSAVVSTQRVPKIFVKGMSEILKQVFVTSFFLIVLSTSSPDTLLCLIRICFMCILEPQPAPHLQPSHLTLACHIYRGSFLHTFLNSLILAMLNSCPRALYYSVHPLNASCLHRIPLLQTGEGGIAYGDDVHAHLFSLFEKVANCMFKTLKESSLALSDRTLSGDGNVLYFHCPRGSHEPPIWLLRTGNVTSLS